MHPKRQLLPLRVQNICGLLLQYFPFSGDGDHLPRDKLSAVLKSFLHGHFYASAAGNLHSHYGDAFDVIVSYDLRKLFGVVYAVQLRAAYKGNLISDEVLVEAAVGVGGAVCGYEKVCAVKIRSVYRGQLYLNGPLGKTAGVLSEGRGCQRRRRRS